VTQGIPKRASILIPTFNRAELLRKALASIQALRLPDGWTAEIVVVDNNCTDHTGMVCEESLAAGPLPVRRVVEPRQGLNHGRNRGVAEAAFEHLVFLDDDMVVDAGWLEGYADLQERFAPDAVMGPVDPIFEESPPSWMTRRMIESVASTYSQKGESAFLVPSERAHELPGCNFAVLKSIALDAGGFHPGLDRCGSGMLAGGDWEFGEQLVLRGRKVAYSPRCRIQHLVSRNKISREGLRARWAGLGATRAALAMLRGQSIRRSHSIRLFLRMMRFVARSYRYRLSRNRAEAFVWELEWRMIWGQLFQAPRTIGSRAAQSQGQSHHA
jgi:glycosyltransferase involved in cell wall biosynthesis